MEPKQRGPTVLSIHHVQGSRGGSASQRSRSIQLAEMQLDRSNDFHQRLSSPHVHRPLHRRLRRRQRQSRSPLALLAKSGGVPLVRARLFYHRVSRISELDSRRKLVFDFLPRHESDTSGALPLGIGNVRNSHWRLG